MTKIGIRELHLETGQWVRRAANNEPVVITDRGIPVATLIPFDRLARGKSLPNRWQQIKKMRRIPVDSAVCISEMRDRG
jgi:prevent-host-death family protein